VEFLRNLHEGESKVEFPVELLFCKVVSSFRNFKKHLPWWVMVNQAKKGKVIQLSNLPLKHGKGGLA
jgi:hypothetical protein